MSTTYVGTAPSGMPDSPRATSPLRNAVQAAPTSTVGQPGAERAGSFHAEGRHVSQVGGPTFEIRVAGEGGSKPVLTPAGAEAVDCHGYVLVLVGVDSYDYSGGVKMCDGGHSCLLVLRVG